MWQMKTRAGCADNTSRPEEEKEGGTALDGEAEAGRAARPGGPEVRGGVGAAVREEEHAPRGRLLGVRSRRFVLWMRRVSTPLSILCFRVWGIHQL